MTHSFPNRRSSDLDGIGEVVIRGGNVMTGYLRRPADTAAVLVDGWLRTGDLGHLDREGWLTLVGRKKDLVIRGGENIYPSEVEAAILDRKSTRLNSSH